MHTKTDAPVVKKMIYCVCIFARLLKCFSNFLSLEGDKEGRNRRSWALNAHLF